MNRMDHSCPERKVAHVGSIYINFKTLLVILSENMDPVERKSLHKVELKLITCSIFSGESLLEMYKTCSYLDELPLGRKFIDKKYISVIKEKYAWHNKEKGKLFIR